MAWVSAAGWEDNDSFANSQPRSSVSEKSWPRSGREVPIPLTPPEARDVPIAPGQRDLDLALSFLAAI